LRVCPPRQPGNHSFRPPAEQKKPCANKTLIPIVAVVHQ
jgi:hypothetical protein